MKQIKNILYKNSEKIKKNLALPVLLDDEIKLKYLL